MGLLYIIQSSESAPTAVITIAALLLAILVAIILHELSHGYVALWNGDDTAKRMGRLSLNPARHFNILGFLMLVLVGFGFANPVPINPDNFRNYKKASILVSVAGVITNFALAFVFSLLFGLVILINVKTIISFYIVTFLTYFTLYSVLININLLLFNILPLYPLDGYRLINCFVPSDNPFMSFMRKYSFVILIVLILLGNLNLFNAINPLDYYFGYGRQGILWLFNKFWGLFGVDIGVLLSL
ncbi:MAG: site-2 protease family protein [Clostridia bacterium]|nr:site-2 protease family protein [Clostridia bacterium]